MKNFVEFLLSGNNLTGIHLGYSIQEVLEKLGDPDEIMGDKTVGYMQYSNGLRFGYFSNKIDELAIIFFGNKVQIEILPAIPDKEEVSIFINQDTMIHEFITTLNDRNISWNCFNEANTSVFCMNINKSTCALFDLYSGKISKISTF